ncbi:MAG TPA: hypothetical protein VJJ83_01915 [Candidatus Babeliales bacterium]|nr:hypothetical protein [Candidatus Babeliales bacterium]
MRILRLIRYSRGYQLSQLLLSSSLVPLALTAAAVPTKDLTLTVRYEADALFYHYHDTALPATLIKYDPHTAQHYRVTSVSVDTHYYSAQVRPTGFIHAGKHADCRDEPCCSLRQRTAKTATELVYPPDDAPVK